MPAQVSKVNLLPPSDFEQSFWGRFLRWAVTTGRYIIILTELVVILAFLSRFKLDEDLRKLNEQINGQVGFLDSQQTQLDQFLKLQSKLNLVDKMVDGRTDPGIDMDYIQNKLDSNLIIKKREFYPGMMSITAVTLSEQAMGQLLSSMSADGVWKSLDVTNIAGDKANGILFTITANK